MSMHSLNYIDYELFDFIFIGGVHKSGTTLLHDKLAINESISSFENTGGPEDEGQYLQNQIKPDIYYGELLFGFSSEAYLTEVELERDPDIGRRIFHEWRRFWDLNKEYLLEKSPINVVRTRFLQAAYPNSKIIIMIRDPRITYMSSKKNLPLIDVNVFFKHWLLVYERLLEDSILLRNFLLIRYEDVIGNPRREFEKISELLSLKVSPSYEILDSDIDVKYKNMWNSLISGNNSMLDEVLLPYWCKELNYEKGLF